MFAFGFKEMAILAFPVAFVGVFFVEIILIWLGRFFVMRRFLNVGIKKKAFLFLAWMVVVLGVAEFLLPISGFSAQIKNFQKKAVLNKIQLVEKSVEILASNHETGSRFALKYTLQFPRSDTYLTFPAYLEVNGDSETRVFGNYFLKANPEYYREDFIFEPEKLYEFIVVFDAGQTDFSKAKANIDICDEKSYFMKCRIISIGLDDLLKDAIYNAPADFPVEPTGPVDEVLNKAEKTANSIRLADLKISSTEIKSGVPLEFSFAITNIGEKDIVIPGGNLGQYIGIFYRWQPISEGAKKTKTLSNIDFGPDFLVPVGFIYSFPEKNQLSPGEKALVEDKISPHFPFMPGKYKLHILLLNNYSLDRSMPVQKLIEDFVVIP